jgi:hypothetical protein
MKKWIATVGALAFVFVAWYVSTIKTPSPTPDPRKPDLRLQLEQVERDIEQAVKTYVPKSGKIDDLTISMAPILKGLPGVEKVTAKGPEKPAKRLIHILDLHFVDKEDFRVDMVHSHDRTLTDAEFDEMYRELLLVIEMVQIEQTGLLRCLRQHGLRAVFLEGFSGGEEKEYRERIEAVRGIQKQSDQMRRQLADVRAILKDASGDRKKKAEDLEKEIAGSLPGLTVPLLEIGATGRLLLRDELEQMLPLEDAKRHQEAKLVKSGKIVVDPEKIRRRREAMVKNVFDRAAVGVIVLGGSHDLSEQLPKDAEYIRVFLRSYPK